MGGGSALLGGLFVGFLDRGQLQNSSSSDQDSDKN
jgi:hypothetical protein